MEDIRLLFENELSKLKSEGVKDIYISDENLKFLMSGYTKSNYQASDNDITTKDDDITEQSLITAKDHIKYEVEKPKLEKINVVEKIDFEIPKISKQEQWEWLKDKVLNCQICNFHVRQGKHLVFGEGNINSEIFFCGEAPGADEEEQGRPFVGKAGQLLEKIINAAGLNREDVYIANIMNWRPEMDTEAGNRPPTQDEMEICLPYLKAQIQVIQPKVIVALGATAVHGLLGFDRNRRMKDIRGNWYEFEQIPLRITFHPSYILRNNTNASKRLIWDDMLAVMEKLHMPISDKQKNFFL